MKNKKVLLSAILAGAFITGNAAAQTPASNTKTVTGGLIEDGIVDKIDTGVAGKDFLFFGGYGMDSRQIQAGIGKRFGEGLWLSIYDGYLMNGTSSAEESITNDSVAHDGVNIDYTDSSSSAAVDGSLRIKNNLAFSAYFNDKIGGTFYWNTDSTDAEGYAAADPTAELSDKSGKTTTKNSSENHTDGTASETEYTKLENIKSTDVFGIAFNGVQTPNMMGERKLYFKLSTLQFTKETRFIDLAYKTKSTLNASSVDGQKQPEYSGKYDFNTYTPSVTVETGITLPVLWESVNTKFKLIDTFSIAFKNNENSYEYSEYTQNSALVKSRKNVSYSMDAGEYSDWKNTITPRFDFDLTPSDGFTLKARAQAAVSIGNTFTGADKYTTVTTTRTVDESTGDVTFTRITVTGGAATEIENFTVSVNPEFTVGLVYEAVPGKFNINMGVSAASGTCTWQKTTKKNSRIPETSTTVFTNAAGETTTTASSVTPANGDGTGADDAAAESEKSTFTAASPSATARFGFTWFLGEKAQLDTYMLYGSSAGTTVPTWAMNVMFAVKF